MTPCAEVDNGVCTYSFLPVDQCARCKGVTLDPELEAVVKEQMR